LFLLHVYHDSFTRPAMQGEHTIAVSITTPSTVSLSLTAHPTLLEDPRDIPPRDSAPKRTLHTRLSSAARHAPCQIVATARDKPSLARPETLQSQRCQRSQQSSEFQSIFLGCPRHLGSRHPWLHPPTKETAACPLPCLCSGGFASSYM
jgi:hypothetical protein